MYLHVESNSCHCSGVGIYFPSKNCLEKLHVFVFGCEGKILLIVWRQHFPSGDPEKYLASWHLPKKSISDL